MCLLADCCLGLSGQAGWKVEKILGSRELSEAVGNVGNEMERGTQVPRSSLRADCGTVMMVSR